MSEELRPATPARATRSRGRARYNAAMKVVRRVYMFAGLFLVPWVLLYGASAFLFNHPATFPDREVRRAGPDVLAGTGLEDFPTAPELAPRVVDALNDQAGRTAYHLVDPGSAAYSRRLFVTATGGEQEHSVLIDPESKLLLIRSGRTAGAAASRNLGGCRNCVSPTRPPRDGAAASRSRWGAWVCVPKKRP